MNAKTKSSTQATATAVKKRLSNAKPQGNTQNLGQTADQQVLQIISGNFDEKTVRTKFTQMAMNSAGAVGACYLAKNIEDYWVPAMNQPSVGRVPARGDFVDSLSERCDEFITTPLAKIEAIGVKGLHGAFIPLRPRGGQPELMLVVARSKTDAAMMLPLMQKIASALHLWLGNRSAADSNWQVIALGSIIELVSSIEKQSTSKTACEEAANILANRIGCSSVAIGLLKRDTMQLMAISGVPKLDHGSKPSQQFTQTLLESATRKQPGVYPALDSENNFLLQAHKQLAVSQQVECVRSHPIFDSEQEVIGAFVAIGKTQLLNSSQVSRFCETTVNPLGSSLQVIGKLKTGILARTSTYIKQKLSATGKFWVLAGVIGLLLLMFAPITYRVRCDCLVEPESKRFAVAPFEGQILIGHKEAGDFVQAGDLLCEMDGRTIRGELASVIAERDQSLRSREIELSGRDIPKTLLAELEYDRLTSQEAVLKYKRDNLSIKSPIDGVVLSGSLERAEAASVETGQVLFEIGPLSPVQIEIEVPDEDINHVEVGFDVKIWIDGQEDEPLIGTVTKIHPRSETRNANNVFIAEVEIPNEDERLRPGMKGSARIDCQQRALGWCLFHKPANWLRSRLTWW